MRAVFWELHIREDGMAKMESYLAVVSSLPTAGTGSSPKILNLPATNDIKRSRGLLRAQPSVVSNPHPPTDLPICGAIDPVPEACPWWIPGKGKRKEGNKETQVGLGTF